MCCTHLAHIEKAHLLQGMEIQDLADQYEELNTPLSEYNVDVSSDRPTKTSW